jgi:glycine betaine/choline ABC-type transport system substrate-binding protein
VRTDFADNNPRVVEILSQIAPKLDNAAMVHMNYLVDIEQKIPRDVAQAWMKEVGLLPK